MDKKYSSIMFLQSFDLDNSFILNDIENLEGIEKLTKLGYNIGKSKNLNSDDKKLMYDLIQSDINNINKSKNVVESVEKLSLLSKIMPYIFDTFVLFIWGMMTIYIVGRWMGFINVTSTFDMSGILGIYSGIVSLATMVIQYHRGSSAGSEKKDGVISLLKK